MVIISFGRRYYIDEHDDIPLGDAPWVVDDGSCIICEDYLYSFEKADGICGNCKESLDDDDDDDDDR